jgi:hypothetical protein
VVGTDGVYSRGLTLVFFGGPDGLPPAPSQAIERPGDEDYWHFGSKASSAGDIDADGFSDLVLGMKAFGIQTNGTGIGHWVFGYRGSPTGAIPAPRCATRSTAKGETRSATRSRTQGT